MFDFIKLFGLLCVGFTLYFLSIILLETLRDLNSVPRRPVWPFLKKLWRKYISNIIYHLP